MDMSKIQALPRETREKILDRLIEIAQFDHSKVMDKDFLDKHLKSVVDAVNAGVYDEPDDDLQYFFGYDPHLNLPIGEKVPIEREPIKSYCLGPHDLHQFKGSKTIFCTNCEYKETL